VARVPGPQPLTRRGPTARTTYDRPLNEDQIWQRNTTGPRLASCRFLLLGGYENLGAPTEGGAVLGARAGPRSTPPGAADADQRAPLCLYLTGFRFELSRG
jgi:hypothetical protein